jgi:phosphosulfolactate phosphohydrolase-like enzyme
LYIDVTPGLRREVKAAAALEDMTVSEFILACVMDRLEEKEDMRVALERLRSPGESSPWEEVKHQEDVRRRGVPDTVAPRG